MRTIGILLIVTGVITILAGMEMPIYRMLIGESMDIGYMLSSDMIILLGIAAVLIGVILQQQSTITNTLK